MKVGRQKGQVLVKVSLGTSYNLLSRQKDGGQCEIMGNMVLEFNVINLHFKSKAFYLTLWYNRYILFAHEI